MATDNQITEALASKSKQTLESTTQLEEGRIIVHKIYTKSQQFVMNGLPDELAKNWGPQLNMQASVRLTPLESEQQEVIVTLNLSAQQLGKAIFQIQIDQAGLFSLQNIPSDQQETALQGACANALFPYAAVTINQLLSQAGLPHVYLNPLNFIALYHEHKKREEEKTADSVETLQ